MIFNHRVIRKFACALGLLFVGVMMSVYTDDKSDQLTYVGAVGDALLAAANQRDTVSNGIDPVYRH